MTKRKSWSFCWSFEDLLPHIRRKAEAYWNSFMITDLFKWCKSAKDLTSHSGLTGLLGSTVGQGELQQALPLRPKDWYQTPLEEDDCEFSLLQVLQKTVLEWLRLLRGSLKHSSRRCWTVSMTASPTPTPEAGLKASPRHLDEYTHRHRHIPTSIHSPPSTVHTAIWFHAETGKSVATGAGGVKGRLGSW